MTSRVLIDGYFLGKPYGFGRFLLELCRALGQTRTEVEFVVAVPAHVDEALLAPYQGLRWFRAATQNRIIWEQITVPKLARVLHCDLIHYPCNTTALYTYGIPFVTTIHDIIFLDERTPIWNLKAFIAERYVRFSFRHLAKRSASIISVSKTTRALLAQEGLESQTIYNTADGFVSKYANQANRSAGRRYILHRGGSAAHRNTRRVIEAFCAAQDFLPEVDLKILGVSAAVAREWGTAKNENIQFLPRLSDEELASLYTGSACVVVASLQEGFGLPIIEAFGFEVPVIASNLDPMREIAADAAILVDPYSTAEISRAMVSLLSDANLARALTAKGRVRVREFASDRIAQQLVAVYGLGDDSIGASEPIELETEERGVAGR